MARRDLYKPGDCIQCDMVFVSQNAVDLPDGYVKGIASTPRTDAFGHKVFKGAFDDSIKRRGLNGPKGVRLLAGHDPEKVAGSIKRLETVGDDLEIEAQLYLDVGYAKDLYTVSKHTGGLNFSVGFKLQEFEFADDEDINDESDPWLLIKKGDLHEVSVVAFPAQPDAEMTFIKRAPLENTTFKSVAEFEKALVASGFRNRSEAHRFTHVVKQNLHLFLGREEPSAPAVATHPLLDVSRLQPMAELIAKAKAALSSV